MKSRYAVRALIGLAVCDEATPGRPVRLADIAAERDMPLQFLEQVFAVLRRAGIVRSRRGASGGYALAKPPGEITVLEVVSVLDGPPSPADCTSGQCDRIERCGAASVWLEAQAALEEVLGGTSIAELLERERLACQTEPMYYI